MHSGPEPSSSTRKLRIEFKMAPGDVAMLTALVRDLKLTFGDKYLVDVVTNVDAIWRHNPYLTKFDPGDTAVEYLDFRKVAYRPALGLSKYGEHIHFTRAFHVTFQQETGIRVPCLFPKADLHLTDEEKAKPLIEKPYWIVVPGGKTDMTTKMHDQHVWQEVVDVLRAKGLRFVQEGATKKLCVHPPLSGVLNVVGLTSIRDIIRNVYHAEGVICGITFPMHLAGAFDKPCVVLAGGREEPWFEAYTNEYNAWGPECAPVAVPHRYLHTLGQLPCCETAGCGRRRVVALTTDHPAQDKEFNKDLCLRPHMTQTQIIPECLAKIKPAQIIEAVLSYPQELSGKLCEPPRLVNIPEQCRNGMPPRTAAMAMDYPAEHKPPWTGKQGLPYHR